MINGTGRAGRVLLYTDGSRVARVLLDELLGRTGAEIVLAGADEQRLEAWRAALEPGQAERVTPFALDPRDGRVVQAAIDWVQVAVCAVGPFRPAPATIAQAALCSGVDYVDLSGRRENAGRVLALARELSPAGDGPAVGTAFSLTALAGALAQLAVRGLDEVDTMRIAVAPGPGSLDSLRQRADVLQVVSRPFRLLRQGVWCTVPGWSEPLAFEFPAPLGARTCRLVNAPECELFPPVFGARRVELRLDTQGLGGPGLALLARMRGAGVPFGARWLARGVAAGASLVGKAASPLAALGVEVEGRYGKNRLRVRCAIADRRGLTRLAALPAAHLVARLVERPGELRGRIPHHTWIDPRGLTQELQRLGIELAIDEA